MLDFISLLWGFIAILILIVACFLLRIYFKDKNKKKLMYALGLFFSSTTFFILAFGYYQNISSNILLFNIYRWGSISYVILLFHTTFEQLYWKNKNFDQVFYSYLFFSCISFTIIISNLVNRDVSTFFTIVGTFIVIINCINLIIKDRDLSSYLFLFSVFSSLVGAVILYVIQYSEKENWNYFAVFTFFISYTFLSLILGAASDRESKDKSGISSYFSIQNKLEDVKDALRLSEEKYRNIVQLAPDGIVTVDLKGYINSCNNAFASLSGYSKEEIVGKHITKLPTMRKRDLPKNLKLLNVLFKGGSQESFQFKWVHKDGSIRFAEARASLLKQNGKTTGLQTIIRDTTNQVKSQEELKNAHLQLKSMNIELEKRVKERTSEIEHLLKQKDEFINQLGHDLKNPLNPLVNLLPMLARKASDSKDREMFEIVIKNIGYMKNLVVKTIKLAQLNSPNTEFSFGDTNLFMEVNKVIDSNKLMIDSKDIKVLNNIDEEIALKLDILRFEELLTNLLSNSIKYSGKSSKIEINAKNDGDFILISIKDAGIGMNKKQLSLAFDEFYKADESRHDFESSGLGMPISKRIVEKHGGRIWAESQGIGKGTTIFFTIPNKDIKSIQNQFNYNEITKEVDKIIHSKN